MTSVITAKQQQRSSREAAATATKTQLDSHAAWQATLDASIACVQQLLTPSQANSKAWRAVSPNQNSTNASISSVSNLESILASAPSTSQYRLDSQLLPIPSPASVQVHRRPAAKASKESAKGSNGLGSALLPPGSSQTGDIYRAVCQVPLGKQASNDNSYWRDVQDAFCRLLATPECRPLWDHMVDDSEVIEELDAFTRISRTVFRLGWPASQRDAITISKSIRDGQTLMDVSTSLPRSPDAPAYLRPAPPYVRSHVNLFAWCIQRTPESFLRVTLFWSWDLKGAWLGMPAGGLAAQLPHVVTSLVSHVAKDSTRVPYLVDFGRNVEVTSRKFDSSRDMLSIDYQVVCEEYSHDRSDSSDEQMSWQLPFAEGWDVHVEVRAMLASMSSTSMSHAWKMTASREQRGDGNTTGIISLCLDHGSDASRAELEQGLRGRVTIQRIAASQDIRLRVNDEPFSIDEVQAEEEATSFPEPILMSDKSAIAFPDDSASVSGLSLRSDASSQSNTQTIAGEDLIKRSGTPGSLSERLAATTATNSTPTSVHLNGKAAHPFDRTNALASLIRRNYIYFTSLLQEPEAKWKAYSDSKGVTITQLDSIDPTLVVYRAEATFVGVSVWDIFATLGNPGAKVAWDRGAEETKLVEDLGDASKLWWTKMKAAWPISPRDNVTVETTYKSPASIHLFSFSTDDHGIFPTLPRLELGSIRTQIDLRGWSIESLNPTTVHITLIEQSDPKGWTSKSSATPGAMTAAVAGVGDFAIKQGGPPIVTRLLGGKTKLARYDHEKGTMRVEYELATNTGDATETTEMGHVECEIRCDLETWCQGLDLVVDPPPVNISCLRRHKLSQGGSGLWLTIEHVAASLEDDLARVTVRRAGSGKEKGSVFVNGARIRVDVDEMKEDEVALLKDKRRSKPKRIPLDLINMSPKTNASKKNVGGVTGKIIESSPLTTTSGPISRAGTPSLPVVSHEALNQAINETNDVFSDERPRQPMTCALDVLFLLRRIHAERGPDPAVNPAGWSLVSQRNGLFVRRRMMQSMSPAIHIQRGDKVVEGLTAEDILTAVSSMQCRKLWDEKVDSSMLLESYGNGATTGFFTTKASFPFRGRAFHLASLTARSGPSSVNLGGSSSTGIPTVYFHASASFPDRNSSFSASKLNPQALPLGKVLIDGWILETLDPYSSTLNYQIPSTRCTHVVAIDYAGSLPIAVNTMWNANLPRSIVAVEEYIKSKGSLPSIRNPPCFVEVLGDGRDEDRNLIWSFEDDRAKRMCTLLTATFNPIDKTYGVLVKIDAKRDTQPGTRSTILTPLPHRPGAISASITKVAASQAASGLSSDGLENLSKATDDQSKIDDAMPRAVSSSSIKSLASKSRPSIPRGLVKKPMTDLIVMDVEVELRHYDRGYEVSVSSEVTSTSKEGMDEALSLRAAPENSRVLPLTVACFDLPPSAVLAATLDPSARPRKHLLRVTLPTASFSGDNQDGLATASDQEDPPQWYSEMQEKGACIRLNIRPLHKVDVATAQDRRISDSDATPNSEIDSQQVPVYFQNARLQVTHVNQTSAMLQKESEKVEEYARLKRVSPLQSLKVEAEENKSKDVLDDRLPALLQRPMAVVKEYRKTAEDGLSTQKGLMEANETISTATSTTEISDPTTPIGKMSADSNFTTNNLPTSASTPIMGILNSYPLSRLGASTAVSTAVANGGVFSKVAPSGLKDRLQNGSTKEASLTKDSKEASPDDTKSKEATPDGAKNETVSSTVKTVMESTGMPGTLVATTEEIRKRLSDVRFSLSTLILVAIIAFLFGSLVRSLLEPADFILVNKTLDELARSPGSSSSSGGSSIQEAAKNEIKRLLEGKEDTTPTVVKRELKRFVELHLIGGRWDLLIAAARR